MINQLKSHINNVFIGIKNAVSDFNKDNAGVGVVEIILILVVLIGLVVIFRDQLTSIVNGIFDRIVTDSNGI